MFYENTILCVPVNTICKQFYLFLGKMSSELNNITLNELLQALGSEPSVGKNLKDTCKRLKFQHNAWRAELQN